MTSFCRCLAAFARAIVLVLCWMVGVPAQQRPGGPTPPRPNIVFILADDLGPGDLGSYGQRKIETPSLDALAARGMRFTQHYAGNAVCAPSRGVLLTGRHPGHAAIRDNRELQPEGQWPLPGPELTIAEVLKPLGYATGAMGKWGLGPPGSEGDPLKPPYDTAPYNGKIKRLTVGSKEAGVVRTVLSGLHEPGSIAVAPDGSWVIADTNAHRVLRVIDGTAREIAIRGAPEPRRGALTRRQTGVASGSAALGWFTTLLTLPAGVGLAPGPAEVALGLEAASGSELADGAPLLVSLEVSRRSDLLRLERDTITLEPKGGPSRTILLAVTVAELPEPLVEAELVVRLDYVACDARNHSACVPGKVHARVPVRLLASGGKARIEFRIALPMLEL